MKEGMSWGSQTAHPTSVRTEAGFCLATRSQGRPDFPSVTELPAQKTLTGTEHVHVCVCVCLSVCKGRGAGAKAETSLSAAHGGLGQSPPPLPRLPLNDEVAPRPRSLSPRGFQKLRWVPSPLGRGTEDISSRKRLPSLTSSHLLLPAAQQAGLSQAQGRRTSRKREGSSDFTHPPQPRGVEGTCVHVCATCVHVCVRVCAWACVITGWLGWAGEEGHEGPGSTLVLEAAARSLSCAPGAALHRVRPLSETSVSPSAQWEQGETCL